VRIPSFRLRTQPDRHAARLTRWYPSLIEELERRRLAGRWAETATSAPPQQVWAYADRHSIRPGHGFDVKLSAGPSKSSVRGRLEIARIGHYGRFDRTTVWRSEPFEVEPYRFQRNGNTSQLLDVTAAALGQPWITSVPVRDTHDWVSGYHAIDFVSDGHRDADIGYVVVTGTSPSPDVLVKLATSTYQAYNRWGGHSLYDISPTEPRGHMVSFDRPTRSEFYEWEYYFVRWIEALAAREGFGVSYASSFDMFADPEATFSPKVLISAGHDEYWTLEEFERAHERIFQRGGNTLFLGANMAYWKVRYADLNAPSTNGGRQMICYKSSTDPYPGSAPDPRLATSRFRDGALHPETMLMGVGYQSNFRERDDARPELPLRVVDAGHPFFDGTGYTPGDSLGDLIGHEWDNRDPEAEYAPPGEDRSPGADRLWDVDRSCIPELPASRLRVLCSGETRDLFDRPGLAESVYFESPAGAKVFAAGTIRWSWGLGKSHYQDERFRMFNENMVMNLLSPRHNE